MSNHASPGAEMLSTEEHGKRSELLGTDEGYKPEHTRGLRPGGMGARSTDLRAHWSMTQRHLAYALGVHPMTVSQVERGVKQWPARCWPWLDILHAPTRLRGWQRTGILHHLDPAQEGGGVVTQFWRRVLAHVADEPSTDVSTWGAQ